MPSVTEQGEYTEIVIGDSPETADFTKYGGYVPLTLELLDKDDTRKLRAYGLELGKAGIRNISEQIAAHLHIQQRSGSRPWRTPVHCSMRPQSPPPEGMPTCLTTAIGTDFTAWDAAAAAVYNQPLLRKNATGYYGTGKKQAIEPKFCLVPACSESCSGSPVHPPLGSRRLRPLPPRADPPTAGE